MSTNTKKMTRMMTRKAHSWWWDSHISPKNSKWLAENLQEMDSCVKEMLKLIETEADSFAKKAEMYYQRRPQLISHVEDFYRMYRALAERYDNVTGELRKNLQSEHKLEGSRSRSGSDFGSEPPTPEPKQSPKPNHRAAGFDAFLGSGGSSDVSKKGSDNSSSDSKSNSDSDSDDDDRTSSDLHQRILELENELSVVNGKLREHEKCKEHSDKISVLENDLLAANEKLHASKEEIMSRQQTLGEHDKCKEMANDHIELSLKFSMLENDLLVANEKFRVSETEMISLQQKLEEKNTSLEALSVELDNEKTLVSKLNIRIIELESEITSLQKMLEEKNTSSEAMSAELNHENTLISKLEARITELESDLSDKYRDDLKCAISNSDQMIEQYKTQLTDASEKFSVERSNLEAKINGLEAIIKELKEEIEIASKEKIQLESSTSEKQHLLEKIEVEKQEACVGFWCFNHGTRSVFI